MNSTVPGLTCYLQGCASDCEKVLRNSMALPFRTVLGTFEKCSKLDLSNKLIRETKKDVFDQGGLIYARSSKAFGEQCRQLKINGMILNLQKS